MEQPPLNSRAVPMRYRFMDDLPAWLRWRYLAFVWVAVLAYGTLIPFEFDLAYMHNDAVGARALVVSVLSSPQWFVPDDASVGAGGSSLLADLLTNVVLYGPLGILLRLGFRKRQMRFWSQIGCTFFFLLTVSYALECVQSMMPMRVPSLFDVLANVGGGLIAALMLEHLIRLAKWSSFSVHRVTSERMHRLQRTVRDPKTRRRLFLAVCVLDLVLIVAWIWGAAHRGSLDPNGRALPFLDTFLLPYDRAMILIGQYLAVYFLISLFISLQFLGLRVRRRLAWVLLAIALLVGVRRVAEIESGNLLAATNFTEPIMALSSVLLLILIAHLFFHAMRCADRRKRAIVVADDRRRCGYLYRD